MAILWAKHDLKPYQPHVTATDGWKLVATWIGCSLVEIAFVWWVLS